MTARLREELRRKRDRRDARARAYREHVCKGELVDVARPVLSGGTAEEHSRLVAERAHIRAQLAQKEADLLAIDFARRCWVTPIDEAVMIGGYFALMDAVGAPTIPAYNSTSPAVRTTGTHGGTIPAL
jgi:hypothetical protein